MNLMGANFVVSVLVVAAAAAGMRCYRARYGVRFGFGMVATSALFNDVVMAANWLGKPMGPLDYQHTEVTEVAFALSVVVLLAALVSAKPRPAV